MRIVHLQRLAFCLANTPARITSCEDIASGPSRAGMLIMTLKQILMESARLRVAPGVRKENRRKSREIGF